MFNHFEEFDIEVGEEQNYFTRVFSACMNWVLGAVRIRRSWMGDILTAIYAGLMYWLMLGSLSVLFSISAPLGVTGVLSIALGVHFTKGIVLTPLIMFITGFFEVWGWYSRTIKSRWSRVKNAITSQTRLGRATQYTRGVVCAFWGEILVLIFVVIATGYIAYKRVQVAFKKESNPRVAPVLADVVYRVCTAMTGVSFLFMLIYGSWKDITQLIAALMGLANWTHRYLSGVVDDPEGPYNECVRGDCRCDEHKFQPSFCVSEVNAAYVAGCFGHTHDLTEDEFWKRVELAEKEMSDSDVYPRELCYTCWAGFLSYIFCVNGQPKRVAQMRVEEIVKCFPRGSCNYWKLPATTEHPGLGSSRVDRDISEEIDSLSTQSHKGEKAATYAKRILGAIWGKRYFMLAVALLVVLVGGIAVLIAFWLRRKEQASVPTVSDVSPTGPGRKRDRKRVDLDDDKYTGAENPWSDLYYTEEQPEAVTTPSKAAERPLCPTADCKSKSKKHLRKFRHEPPALHSPAVVKEEAFVPSSMPLDIDYSKLAFFLERGDEADLVIATCTRVHNVFFTAQHVKEGRPTHVVIFNASPKWVGIVGKSKIDPACIVQCVPCSSLKVFKSKDNRDLLAFAVPTAFSGCGKGYHSGRAQVGQMASVAGFHSSQGKILIAAGTIASIDRGFVTGQITTDWGVSGGPWCNKSGQVFAIHNGVDKFYQTNCGVLLTAHDVEFAKSPPSVKVASSWTEANLHVEDLVSLNGQRPSMGASPSS